MRGAGGEFAKPTRAAQKGMPRKGIAERVAVEVLAVRDLEPEMVEGRTAAQRKSNGNTRGEVLGAAHWRRSSRGYARKVERKRDTGERMDALIRGADWAQTSTSDDPNVAPVAVVANKNPAGAGLL
jgi:hypothetical protein